MEDPTFSDIISFICLSDSQFIWLPIKFFFYSSVPTTVHLQKKGHKVFLTRKSTTPNTSATTQKWWEQNGCHTIKSVILYLIYTRNCVDLKRTEHGDFGAELNEIFASFQRKKKVLVCLKYESSLQLEKQKKERQQNPQNRQQLTEYFLAQTSCSPSIKMGGRIKEWGSIHNTWIINRFSSTAYGNSNTGREGGVGGHLRRISETGKVTKLSLE